MYSKEITFGQELHGVVCQHVNRRIIITCENTRSFSSSTTPQYSPVLPSAVSLIHYCAVHLHFLSCSVKEIMTPITYNSFFDTFSPIRDSLLLHMSDWACCIMTRGMLFNACVCVCACLSYFLCELCNHLLKCSVFTRLSTFQINIKTAVQTTHPVKSSLECYWHTLKDLIQILFVFTTPC